MTTRRRKATSMDSFFTKQCQSDPNTRTHAYIFTPRSKKSLSVIHFHDINHQSFKMAIYDKLDDMLRKKLREFYQAIILSFSKNDLSECYVATISYFNFWIKLFDELMAKFKSIESHKIAAYVQQNPECFRVPHLAGCMKNPSALMNMINEYATHPKIISKHLESEMNNRGRKMFAIHGNYLCSIQEQLPMMRHGVVLGKYYYLDYCLFNSMVNELI